MSISLLEKNIKEKKSTLILTLAGISELLPEDFKLNIHDADTAIKAVGKFDRLLIDILHNIISAVIIKPIHYWICGISGVEELEKTLSYASEKCLYTIIDYNLSVEYDTAAAFLTCKSSVLGKSVKTLASDSITLLPYLGEDVLQQLIFIVNKYSKGLFCFT